MSKEEKNSHVLPFKYWIVHFSPYCRATPQGIREKYGKYRVIFDSSMQTSPDKIVLNQVTLTDHEATSCSPTFIIGVSAFRMRSFTLLLPILQRVFCFPRLSADIAGAFGFVAEDLYFASTSHVFGSKHLSKLLGSVQASYPELDHYPLSAE